MTPAEILARAVSDRPRLAVRRSEFVPRMARTETPWRVVWVEAVYAMVRADMEKGK